MKENKFQTRVIGKIQRMFPGAVILKNDPNYLQGIPDILILYKNRWAALECKRNRNAIHQPNQDYYVDILNEMSFAAFLYPENEEEVLDGLQRTFEA